MKDNDKRSSRPSLAITLNLTIAITVGLCSSAGAQTELRPNLTPLPAFDIHTILDGSGTTTLRFSTTTWNHGDGVLQLVADEGDTGSGIQTVFQEVFSNDGTSTLFEAGNFEFHDSHGHFHFEGFAMYTWKRVDAPGGSAQVGSKVTFCVMDTDKIDTRLPGASKKAVFTTCGDHIQGMSVGWGDTYGSHLPGQELDITGAPDGIYQLIIEADPDNRLLETDESDNLSCVLINYQQPFSLTVLDASGSCSAVTSIFPQSAPMGGSIEVSIMGYGLNDGMDVRFEHCNPRPLASNVWLSSDTFSLDTLTATITVPDRKKLGRDSVCDVRVGDSILQGAFTVTP